MSNIRKGPALGNDGNGSEQTQGHLSEHEFPNERYQDQLASLLFLPEDEEIDSEALASILARLEEADPVPETLVLDAEKSLERFHQQNAPVFDTVKAENRLERTESDRKRQSRLSIVRVIAIAAVLILLLCTTAQALGFDVLSSITRWTSEIFRLGGYSASFASVQHDLLEEGETVSFDSLEEAMAAFGIEAPIVPKRIPERFELVSVVATKRFSGTLIYAYYESEGGYLYVEYREISGQIFDTVEKEYSDAASYFVREIEHHLISDNERRKALWVNGDFECQLHGTVSEQELEDMIDSIY